MTELKPYRANRIEKIVKDIDQICRDNNTDIMDAVLIYAKDTNIEIEVLGDIVRSSDILMERMIDYTEDRKLVEKINRLAFE